tara:strand:+ start:1224 stop:2075 length:852 start_codon:yes stop_codon:yes gene_type:complete
MATLAGKKVKDTYAGMLKTSDESALTASLKVVQDGLGNASALSLSTAEAKVEALKINTVSSDTSTKVLVWDDSTKDVGYKTFSTFDSVDVSVAGTSSPNFTITDNNSNSTTITFSGGNGIDMSRQTNTFTISLGDRPTKSVSSATTLTEEDTGKLIIVDSSTLDGDTITLPGAVAGRELEFVLEEESTTAFFIEAATGDNFIGRVILTDGTSTKVDRETKSTSSSTNIDKLRIDSNAANTGGQVGDRFTCRAVDDRYWLVSAELSSSGTITTAGGFFTTTTPA